MKKLEALPLYRDTFELLNAIVKVVEKFPKAYKYNIGNRLLDSSLELMKTLSLCARYNDDSYFNQYVINLQLTKTLIRLCNENHIISVSQTATLALRMESIESQIEKIIK